MANTYNSANMSLPIPVVGIDGGPDYASNINASLTLIDSHDHSSGKGVPINPAGISINSDLSFGGNNLTLARSLRLQPQSAPLALASDLGCLYESGVDLYYNDGSGNQVRITQSGGVAGSPGSIAGLTSPASATYVAGSQTFVWQSAASTPANLDAASILIRNLTASSNAITLSAPAALGSNYSIVLPTLPGSTKFLNLDSSGNIGAVWGVDNSTIEISSNNLQLKAGGITTTQISASAGILKSQLASLGQQTSAVSVGQVTTSTTFVNMTSMTQTITTSGRPVFIIMSPGTTGGVGSDIVLSGSPTGVCVAQIQLLRNATVVGTWSLAFNIGNSTTSAISFPTNIIQVDAPSAGTYTYQFQFRVTSSGMSVTLNPAQTTVYEL